MGYEFKTDLNIEYPFFIEMATRLGGVKRRDNFNGKETFRVQCPNCKKHKAVIVMHAVRTPMCWHVLLMDALLMVLSSMT